MRLIDADTLIESMKKTETEYENAMTCPSWWSSFNVISEQPTAYDIDKVIKELEKATQYIKINGKPTSVKAIHPVQAIEIVKQGCVSDDVCEWKYTKEIMDNAEFKVGCNQNALKRGIVPNNFSYHNFKYCPYCGKKIKMVE